MSEQLMDPRQVQRISHARVDLLAFGSTYMPEGFERPPTRYHDILNRYFVEPWYDKDMNLITKKFLAWCGFRGLMKSTWASFLYPLHVGAFETRFQPYILLVSNNEKKATEFTRSIKLEIETNQVIRADFPHMAPGLRWADDNFETVGGMKVQAVGAGQDPRGFLKRFSRPTHIICDDFENPRTDKSEIEREDKFEWLLSSLLPTTDPMPDKESFVIFLGNMYGPLSAMNRIKESKSWVYFEIPICDKDHNPTIPEWFPKEYVEELYERYKEAGKERVFAQEFMCRPIDDRSAIFKEEFFQYYYEDEKHFKNNPNMVTIVLLDPASTSTDSADESAIAGATVDLRESKIYFREVEAGRWPPEETLNRYFAMAERLGAITLAYETNALKEYITLPVKNTMFRLGKMYNLVPIHNNKHKEDRVAALQPWFAQKMVWLHPTKCDRLKEQLVTFPASAAWDVMDCAANIVPAMEQRQLYFLKPRKPGDEQRLRQAAEAAIGMSPGMNTSLGFNYGRAA